MSGLRAGALYFLAFDGQNTTSGCISGLSIMAQWILFAIYLLGLLIITAISILSPDDKSKLVVCYAVIGHLLWPITIPCILLFCFFKINADRQRSIADEPRDMPPVNRGEISKDEDILISRM